MILYRFYMILYCFNVMRESNSIAHCHTPAYTCTYRRRHSRNRPGSARRATRLAPGPVLVGRAVITQNPSRVVERESGEGKARVCIAAQAPPTP